MQYLPKALTGLSRYRQFILCEFVWNEARGKFDKRPLDPNTLRPGSINDLTIRLSAEEACAASTALGEQYGVGFVFTEDDPFFFLDLDQCIDPDTGELSDIANELMSATPGAAIERSHSGTGLHIFGTGQFGGHKKKNARLGIEFYTELRFAALTGTDAQGDSTVDCTASLTPLVAKYFPPETSVADETGSTYTDEPHPDWNGPTDDEVLIGKMCSSGSAEAKFSNAKASFNDLFTANESVLAVAYPDSSGLGKAYDASSADAALAQHLAFWTGNHETRMSRIMYRSALAREKWDLRAGYYLPRTIKGATARQKKYYNKGGITPTSGNAPAAPQGKDSAASTITQDTPGVRFMTIEAQKEFFKDYVYVAEVDQIFTPENGRMYKQANFKHMFSNYTFALDLENSKTCTNAWQAFVSSQGVKFKKVHEMEFRADFTPGSIRTVKGDLVLNTYIDRRGKRIKGDATPFLDLIARMLPDQNDQLILISYMAGVVQFMGTKFRYCPVVQGTEGNGKSTLLNVMEYAVGEKYTHKPSAAGLLADGGKFNDWMGRTILVGVEDIHMDTRSGGTYDALKPIITNERLEIQGKGKDQKTGDNRGNWYISVNGQNDVPITDSSRRYCIFFTAQQSAADKLRDGMTDAYWNKFWAWMNGTDPALEEDYGYAVCNDFLSSFVIPAKYNPKLLASAPHTSATASAVIQSRDEFQQYVVEAIESGQMGFRNGWISSYYLEELIAAKRIQGCPPNRRRNLLQGIGYDWHPALDHGRVGRAIDAENQRRVVPYIKNGHIALNLTDPVDIREAYMTAQDYGNATLPVPVAKRGTA